MDKRSFLKKTALASLGIPLYANAIPEWIHDIERIPTNKIVKNDDFWLKVRQDYKLKPDYINLESGYYNIIPHI